MMSGRMSRRLVRGAAAVELALMLPVMLAMAALVVDLGRLTYQYNVLHKAVREAGRYLSTKAPGASTEDPRRGTGSTNAWTIAAAMVNEYKSSLNCPAAGACLTVTIQDSAATTSLRNIAFSLPGETGRGSYNLVRVEVSGYEMQTLVVGPLLRLTGYSKLLLPTVAATFEQG